MKIRTIVLTSFVIAVLAYAAPSVCAQGHTIRGKVRNASGVNMAQITISLESGNGGLINQTVTNNEGDFFFGGLGDTSYVITVSAPDYNPISERVEFVRNIGPRDPGETRTVEITLVRTSVRSARAGLTFAQNVPKTAQTSYESALKLSKQGKQEEAIAALREAIRIFPDYFNAHFVLANEFMKTGKHGEAIAQLDEARRINPRDDRIYELFGLVLMQQRKYAVAAAVFAEASRLNAVDPQYPLMRGIALIEYASSISPSESKSSAAERSNALSDAEKNLARAYELSNRKLIIIHLHLARVYEKQGNRSRAAAELEEYLKENPNAPNAAAIRDGIKKLRSQK
jgi:tetratricopeptide (TPR) repeat protein